MNATESLTSEGVFAKIEAIDALLATESQWTQRYGAVNQDGKNVAPASDDAVKWCLIGASWKICGNQQHHRQVCMCLYQTIATPQITIQEINDRSTFAEIKEILARAKEVAKSNDPWTPYLQEFPKRLT